MEAPAEAIASFIFYATLMLASICAVALTAATLAIYASYWMIVISYENPEQTAWLLQWL